MLWFYEREGDESLRVETRYDNDTNEFVVRVQWPNGREQVERFSEFAKFQAWLTAFDNRIEAEQWKARSSTLLPYGWPDKPLL